MATLSGIISNGSIILFVGNSVPPEFTTPITFAGNQPTDQRVQGYPQARAFLARPSGNIKPEMGVHADDLTQ
jgi:hypothetical protein